MKLKYSMDTVLLESDIICVPIGPGATECHGVLKLNKSGKEIIDLLSTEVTMDEIINTLTKKYENDFGQISSYVINTIETLRKAGLLIE